MSTAEKVRTITEHEAPRVQPANDSKVRSSACLSNRSASDLSEPLLGLTWPILAPTATEPALLSRAARGDAPAEVNVIEVSGGGRTAVGDRRPAARAAAPSVSSTPAPAPPKPAKMGCSGYRIKHGTSDEAIVKAIREHAARSVAETADSPWISATDLTDEQLLAVIGWSFLAETACARVAQHLRDMSG